MLDFLFIAIYLTWSCDMKANVEESILLIWLKERSKTCSLVRPEKVSGVSRWLEMAFLERLSTLKFWALAKSSGVSKVRLLFCKSTLSKLLVELKIVGGRAANLFDEKSTSRSSGRLCRALSSITDNLFSLMTSFWREVAWERSVALREAMWLFES